MEAFIVDIIKTLGVSGLALWLMWKMYENAAKRFREKDQELLDEIGKRDTAFYEYAEKVRAETTDVLRRAVIHMEKHGD